MVHRMTPHVTPSLAQLLWGVGAGPVQGGRSNEVGKLAYARRENFK